MSSHHPSPANNDPAPAREATGGAVLEVPARAAVSMQTVTSLCTMGAAFSGPTDGVLLQRALPSFVTDALLKMALDRSMSQRLWLPANGAGEGMLGLFQAWGQEIGPAERWLAEDVHALAQKVAKLLDTDKIILRVEIVDDNACRKFHRDAIRARLICTYAGPGTEYGVAEFGQDPDIVEQAGTGCPIILKGKAWPIQGDPLLAHRSPPVEGTGTKRLVVVIDEASPAFQ